MCQGANIRQEELGGNRGATGRVQTLAGYRRVLHVIGNGRGLLHGAFDTFDYSQTGLCCHTFSGARKKCSKTKTKKIPWKILQSWSKPEWDNLAEIIFTIKISLFTLQSQRKGCEDFILNKFHFNFCSYEMSKITTGDATFTIFVSQMDKLSGLQSTINNMTPPFEKHLDLKWLNYMKICCNWF